MGRVRLEERRGDHNNIANVECCGTTCADCGDSTYAECGNWTMC